MFLRPIIFKHRRQTKVVRSWPGMVQTEPGVMTDLVHKFLNLHQPTIDEIYNLGLSAQPLHQSHVRSGQNIMDGVVRQSQGELEAEKASSKEELDDLRLGFVS